MELDAGQQISPKYLELKPFRDTMRATPALEVYLQPSSEVFLKRQEGFDSA